jgi:WD40 repeat protein
VASPNGRIKCGRTQEGAAKRTLHQCRPSKLVFSSDTRFLAGVGALGGCRAGLKVWNVEKGTGFCRTETELGSNPLICFSPDSLRLVTTGEGSTINLWDLTTGKRIWSVSAPRPIARLAFSKESQAVVAVFADGSVQRF